MATKRECQILVLSGEAEQEVAGSIFLEGSTITGHGATPVLQSFIDGVIADPVLDEDDDPITAEDDPEAWFDSLPAAYNGSYMRAMIVGEGGDAGTD